MARHKGPVVTKTVTLTCTQCGKTIVRHNSMAIAKMPFCSYVCHRLYQQNVSIARADVTEHRCKVCDTLKPVSDFTVTGYGKSSQPIRRRVCKPCVAKASYEKNKKRKPVNGIERTCKVCSKAFSVFPSIVNRGHKTSYCSRECYMTILKVEAGNRYRGRPLPKEIRQKLSQSTENRLRGENHPDWKEDFIKVCSQCGTNYQARGRGNYGRNLQRFCSKACWYAHIKENPQQHPSYKHGHTVGGKSVYYGREWSRQADKARLRDDYTCQVCGIQQTERQHDVHHIQSFASFDGDTRRAHHIANLITLCHQCHIKVEVGNIELEQAQRLN